MHIHIHIHIHIPVPIPVPMPIPIPIHTDIDICVSAHAHVCMHIAYTRLAQGYDCIAVRRVCVHADTTKVCALSCVHTKMCAAVYSGHIRLDTGSKFGAGHGSTYPPGLC